MGFSRAETSVCGVNFLIILEERSNKPFSSLLETEVLLVFLDERSVQAGFWCLIDFKAKPQL